MTQAFKKGQTVEVDAQLITKHIKGTGIIEFMPEDQSVYQRTGDFAVVRMYGTAEPADARGNLFEVPLSAMTAPPYKPAVRLEEDDWEFLLDLMTQAASVKPGLKRKFMEEKLLKYKKLIKEQLRDDHMGGCDDCGNGAACSTFPVYLR